MPLSVIQKPGVDHGTTADKIVVLDGFGRLPAVDGSQLVNLPAASDSSAGVIELATDAEAQAASATNRALVPANLAATRDYTPTLTKSTSYSMAASDRGCLVKFTSAPATYSLLAAATAGAGFTTKVRNAASSGSITIDPSGSETIDGASTYTLNPGQSCWVVCDGSTWATVGAGISAIATSRLLGRSTAGTGAVEQISVGTGLSLSGGTLACTVTQTVAKIGHVSTSTPTSGPGTIPFDSTAPTNTEGTQFMSLAYTPTSSTNLLKIDVVFHGACDGDYPLMVALFRSGQSTAISTAMVDTYDVEDGAYAIPLTHLMTAGTTSTITFTVRAGTVSGTTYFNQARGGQTLGSTLLSSIFVTEYVQ